MHTTSTMSNQAFHPVRFMIVLCKVSTQHHKDKTQHTPGKSTSYSTSLELYSVHAPSLAVRSIYCTLKVFTTCQSNIKEPNTPTAPVIRQTEPLRSLHASLGLGATF
eukprot:jgi/Botrbrau1/8607/Bobra.0196s0007.1